MARAARDTNAVDRSGRATARAIALAVITCAVGVGACERDSAPPYATAAVDRGRVVDIVTAAGTVRPLSLTNVGAELSGRVAVVAADFNDAVERDQPLAYLDEQAFAARVREVRAELDLARSRLAIQQAGLARARARLSASEAHAAVVEAERVAAAAAARQANADVERLRALAQKGTTSASDRQQAESRHEALRAEQDAATARLAAQEGEIAAAHADVAMAEAEVANAQALIRQREAALSQAEVNLRRTVIRAPFDGVVIRRSIEPGQTVAASLQAPTLFTLAKDLTAMQVETRVDEADIGRIEPGQAVEFSVEAYPGRRFSGIVEQIRIAPELMQNVVTYTVLVSASNADLSLLPGMTATVHITVAAHEDVVRVPNAALRFRAPPELSGAHPPADAGTTRLWVSGDGEARPVDVVLGPSDARYTAVREGPIEPGQHVIVGLADPN
jgi:HlyD family secretion protein